MSQGAASTPRSAKRTSDQDRVAVRVLYLLTHAGLFRNFDSTLRLLVERGHEVVVSFDSARYPSTAFEQLRASSSTLAVGCTPPLHDDRWAALGRGVRAASDYVRYLDPRYAGAPKLRARAQRQVPVWLRGALRPGVDTRRLDRGLRGMERALPLSEPALRFLRDRRPDLLVVSPLFGSPVQLEVLRAAHTLGIPTVLTVASWDNLTNKGLIRELPDRVVVWNEAQRQEAVRLHDVSPERIVVTGAQNFDEWFSRCPSTSYAEFAGRLGLRADRPFLLYLGSSSFIAPKEAEFAAEWLQHVRASGQSALDDVGVLFRPHPQNARQWNRPDLLAAPQVAIYPPPAAAPQQTGKADWSREDFYDSMHHAAAVIGVNTTAMIESAVVGRGVYSMLAPAFRDTQEGTLHFEHLRSVNGGLLHLSDSFDVHLEQLGDAVRADGVPDARARRFVEAFVRPHGLDRAATPVLVDALEAAAQAGPGAREAQPSPAWLRPALEPLALVAAASERGARARKRKRKRHGVRKRLRRRAAGFARGVGARFGD